MDDQKWERTQWFNPMLDDYPDGSARKETLVPCQPALPGLESVEPNVISSRMYRVDDDRPDPYSYWRHSPVLDIDFPARLVPSTTEGHFHLYLDGLVMVEQDYMRFLRGMATYGLIEKGYYEASLRRKMSCVRLPHVKK